MLDTSVLWLRLAVFLDTGFLIVVLSAILTGSIVKVGKGWGKIAGKSRFSTQSTLALFFLVEGFMLFVITTGLQSYVVDYLVHYPLSGIGLTLLTYVLFRIWFAENFGFRWKERNRRIGLAILLLSLVFSILGLIVLD